MNSTSEDIILGRVREIQSPGLHAVDCTMFWANESGGVKRYITAKREHLLTVEGWAHDIVVPGTLGAEPPDVPGLPLPFSTGFRVPVSSRSAKKVMLDLAPNIIEAGDPYQLAWTALEAAEELNIPAVAFYHSDLPELVARVFGHTARRAANAYARKLYPRFDLVFAPSLHAMERLEEMGVHNVVHQPLGVCTRTFHPSRHDLMWRGKMGVPRDTKVLLYVGRFAVEKNLQTLVDAVQLLGDGYLLVAIGSGPVPPQGSRVKVIPYEGDSEALATAMASADMLVHAGTQETFGLVALEAMSCGLPVVASADGGLGELVDSSVGYAVPRADAEEFAEAIRAVCERDFSQLSKAARHRARAYDWQMVLPKLVQHYRMLIGRGGEEVSERRGGSRAA